MSDYIVYPVANLETRRNNEPERVEVIKKALDTFSCVRSPFIEKFVHEDIIKSEECGESRSFLLLEEGTDRLLGFFALGITSILWENVEKSAGWRKAHTKKERRVLNRGLHLKDGYVGAFTIGELARADTVSKNELSGETLLGEALSMIMKAHRMVGGRFILVDSRRKLYERLYSNAGFMEFAVKDSPNEGESEEFVVSIVECSNLPADIA